MLLLIKSTTGLTGAHIEFSCVGLRGGLGVPPLPRCRVSGVRLLVWVPCRGVCPSLLEMSCMCHCKGPPQGPTVSGCDEGVVMAR